jgi:hypothetical protein
VKTQNSVGAAFMNVQRARLCVRGGNKKHVKPMETVVESGVPLWTAQMVTVWIVVETAGLIKERPVTQRSWRAMEVVLKKRVARVLSLA